MNWEAIGVVAAIVVAVASFIGWLNGRSASRVRAPRVECDSFLDEGQQLVVSRYKVAGPDAELWSISSVRISGPVGKLAPMVPKGDDGYGNSTYGPGVWDTYLDLTEYFEADGIATSPADQNVQLIFTLFAKSDNTNTMSAPVLIKTMT